MAQTQLYRGKSSYSGDIIYSFDGKAVYKGRSSYSGDILYSWDGKYIYKYTFTKVTDIPTSLIISYDGGNTKVYDGVAFVNHGYYVQGQNTPTKVITTTGISKLHYDSPRRTLLRLVCRPPEQRHLHPERQKVCREIIENQPAYQAPTTLVGAFFA